MRIGVVADTHTPEFLPRIPAAVLDRLRACELILHAGDVTGQSALDQLAQIAPVLAVRGDHDRGLPELPESREFNVGKHRLALVHGNRSRLIEEPITFWGTVTLGHFWPAPRLFEHLKRRFPEANAIVYGHTHAPRNSWFEGTLMFNPGAVYQVTPEEAERRLGNRPNWFEWTWLQVIRRRRRLLSSSMGFLEVTDDGITGRLTPL